MDITQAIKAQAHHLGFSLVGITGSDPLPHADVFKAWLDQGHHGEMDYLNTGRSQQMRAHPGLLLPGCQSIVVLANRYPAPAAIQPGGIPDHELRGKFAAYACGEDYHLVLPEKMHTLVQFIEDQVGHGIPNRWYTDTGPILERELAQRAGLGWIGKNTCLIDPSGGSYFFLAEILLSLELEPDPPFTDDRCGTCHRCLDACPTSCILPNRTLDARRCISYLTIELKNSIPLEYRPMLDGWVFGCDICQQVCPWNRFATTQASPMFGQKLVDSAPDLLTEMSLSGPDFKSKYRQSPLNRSKRRGYLRNLAVALGNLQATAAVPVLAEVIMYESEPLVRSHAAWALGRIGGPDSKQALQHAFGHETDPLVISEIVSAIESITHV